MEGSVLPRLTQEAWASRRDETLRWQLTLGALPPVEAIVFDAYGTLFDVRTIEAACARLTPDAATFAALWRAKQLEYTWLCTLMGAYVPFEQVTAEALDYALRRHDLAPDAALRRAALDAWLGLEPFPEAPAALARLADRPLAILSNGSPAMLGPLTARDGLDGIFRHILSADAAGAYKPDPRVYGLAPAALGRPVDRILFVSSNAWDAVGAKAHGFGVAWCNRGGAPLDGHGPAPDLELRSLDQLADALGR